MNEFVRKDDKIYVNVPYAEGYIPQSLFNPDLETKSSIAVRYGEGFKLVGIFNMRFYDSDEEPRDSKPLRTFNYPNMIMTYPSESSIATLKLSEFSDAEPYIIMKYYMGDVIMDAEEVQAVANCTKLLNMITKGKIPNTIPYDKLVEIWHNNFTINNFNPRVPSLVLQMIWAEMCRDPDDITKPFRMKYGLGNADTTHYTETNMNNVSAASSVFSALSFERIKEKLASSVNMTRNGTEQMRSPVEEVLSM